MNTRRWIALSLRGALEPAYGEERDAIGRDWWPFLKVALPGFLPLLLPNDAELAPALCSSERVAGLVLTGGNDVGSDPTRDAAEEAAYLATISRGLPVLGVCRGLQFLSKLNGGRILPVDPAVHLAKRHGMKPLCEWVGPARDVNSFHRSGVELPEGGPLVASAIGSDDAIEAIHHRDLPIRAILWHPEREPVASPSDLKIFRDLFLPPRCRLPEAPLQKLP